MDIWRTETENLFTSDPAGDIYIYIYTYTYIYACTFTSCMIHIHVKHIFVYPGQYEEHMHA